MHGAFETARRTTRASRRAEAALRLPLVRDWDTLPWRLTGSGGCAMLASAQVVHAARTSAAQPGAFLIGGGEPFHREDIGRLIAELAAIRPTNLGVCSSGYGLTRRLVEQLRAAGLQRIVVPFHCARSDAHDWLVGRSGALKTVHRAIRTAVDADLPVTADVVLTRPTAPHVAETVELLGRIGVRSITVRRLTADDTDGTEFVPLSPRLALLGPALERAAAIALERRLTLVFRDLPLCVAPRLRPLFASTDSELWITPEGEVRRRSQAVARGCATCPGAPACAGAPPDYVSRFGWEEFADPEAIAVRMRENVDEQQQPTRSEPMVFSWAGPRRVRCDACGDVAPEGPSPSYESTRVIRARLVQAARYRPALVRLVGADLLAHPHAAALIYDAVRLFPHVEVAGEASAIVDWSDLDRRRLKELKRIDVALYGPDAATHDAHCGIPGAFAAMQRGIERIRQQTPIAVGAYAILHDARWVAAYASAWARGALPGAPRFRLSPRGGSIDELIDAARTLPLGPARSALLAVLPRCVCERRGMIVDGDAPAESRGQAARRRMQHGHAVLDEPCGSDPTGAFTACAADDSACTAPTCPGMAVGWQSTARSERCSSSI
jgi:hypothetical protein